MHASLLHSTFFNNRMVRVNLGPRGQLEICIGSRSERGGARRAPTKRVFTKQVKLRLTKTNRGKKALRKTVLKPKLNF